MAGDERQTRRAAAGTLLIAALIGAAVLIFFLDTIVEGLRPEYEVVAVVDGAPGITEGSPVWIGGKEVGAVSRIAFLPAGRDTVAQLALTLDLPSRLQPQVRTDSRVRLTSVGMISERVVDILPGTAGASVLAPGDTLYQRVMVSAAELTARASAVRAGLDTVLVEVRALAPAAYEALEQTRTAFAGMELAMAEARVLQADLKASPGLALLRDARFTASLERARSHLAGLPGMLAQLRQRTGEGGEVGAAVARLQLRTDSLSAQLAALAAMSDYPNGSAARFSQDTALARALRDARAELDSLVAEVRRAPLRFIR